MLSKWRDASQPLARRLVEPLARAGLTPHQLTLAGLSLGAGAGLALAWGHPRAALLAGLGAALADWLDGPLARLLHAVADRLVEGFLLVGLAGYFPRLACACLLLAMLTSYIKARMGLVILLDNSDWPGWGDRADRLVLLLASLAALPNQGLCALGLGALLALTGVGCLQRMAYARARIEACQVSDLNR